MTFTLLSTKTAIVAYVLRLRYFSYFYNSTLIPTKTAIGALMRLFTVRLLLYDLYPVYPPEQLSGHCVDVFGVLCLLPIFCYQPKQPSGDLRI